MMKDKTHAANQKLFEATTEKLQEIRESVSKRINSIEVKVADMEKTVDGKLVMMEKKISNPQSQRPEPVRVVPESTARIKPSHCFDSSSPRVHIPVRNRSQ